MKNVIRTFGSDNFSSVDPAILKFLQDINAQGHMPGYGADPITEEARQLFRQTFGESEVLFVPTGTGANILGVSLLLEHPYDAVICSSVSHIFEEETGALSAHLGAHIFTVPHKNGKVRLQDIKDEVNLRQELGFHSSLPKVVSIANTTEYGAYYTPDEIKEIADFCHANDMYLHMDGCRLPNAAAAMSVSLRSLTKDVGVDALSFGGAKNGLMNAEAVVLFNASKSDRLRMQKQAMQLPSKMRYTAGQFIPYLKDGLWLKHAQHSNQLTKQLAENLRKKLNADITFTQPVMTNQVFCILPKAVTQNLRESGHVFYDWNSPDEVRFVVSWDNTIEDIRSLIALV